MDTIGQHLAFVNEQVAFHQKKARLFSDVIGKEWRQKLHMATAVKFQMLADFLGESGEAFERAMDVVAPKPKGK